MPFIIPKIRQWGQNVELHVVCRLLSLLKMCRKGDNFHSVTMTCLFVKQTLWQCKHRLPLPCIDQIHRPGPLEFSCPCSVGWGTSCGAVRGWPVTDKITGVISLSIVLFAATLPWDCVGEQDVNAIFQCAVSLICIIKDFFSPVMCTNGFKAN